MPNMFSPLFFMDFYKLGLDNSMLRCKTYCPMLVVELRNPSLSIFHACDLGLRPIITKK